MKESQRAPIEDLDQALISIGFGLAGPEPRSRANLEDALLAGSIEALEKEDGRLFLLLIAWLELPSPRLNADRWVRLLQGFAPGVSTGFRAFWRAFAEWKRSDRRFARLLSSIEDRGSTSTRARTST
jgi:hypothetical protein